MDLLAEAGFRLMGVTEALASHDIDPGCPIVAITIDDGYDNLPDAAAVVLGHGGGYTAYVVTNFADRAERGFLDWDGIRILHSAGVEIGSHTCTHRELDISPLAVAWAELRESRRQIESALGGPVVSVSYPYGYWSHSMLRVVREAGYHHACCVGRCSARCDNPLALPRLEPRASMSDGHFIHMIAHGEPGVGPRAKRVATPLWRLARRGVQRAKR